MADVDRRSFSAVDLSFSAEAAYLPIAELEDFMPIGERQRLIRRVLCVRGDMTFRIEADPRFDYGRVETETVLHEHGAVFRSPSLTLALSTRVDLRSGESGVVGEFTLAPGESESFVLETGSDTPSLAPPDAMREE